MDKSATTKCLLSMMVHIKTSYEVRGLKSCKDAFLFSTSSAKTCKFSICPSKSILLRGTHGLWLTMGSSCRHGLPRRERTIISQLVSLDFLDTLLNGEQSSRTQNIYQPIK